MDFNSLLAALHDSTEVFTIQDIVLTITLSFALSLIIGWIYKITHRGVSYSQSYVQTLVMMAMVVGIVMLIIGSNIARAFTLVGALSIVRFRNAVKETRDVGYIFFAMAIGMACGTRFYLLAVTATLVIAALIWVMDRYDFFSKEAAVQLLKIRLPSDMTYRGLFDETFRRYVDRYDLVAMETVLAGTLTELVYSVELKRNAEVEAFLRELGELNQNNKVVLVTGQQEADL
ncbi:MAG: DUF4956 domain-containing protein [Chloroflexota bacterium]|nr:DUF4956 domain-containing protein [Chloroflexota bacterium]